MLTIIVLTIFVHNLSSKIFIFSRVAIFTVGVLFSQIKKRTFNSTLLATDGLDEVSAQLVIPARTLDGLFALVLAEILLIGLELPAQHRFRVLAIKRRVFYLNLQK